jgi:uncharacterized repeat protein (TIGR02543 family)
MKKRDSVNKKLLYVGAICSLVSLFTACEALGPEPEPVTVSYEKAVARIQIESGIPGRTVRPDVALEDVSVWKLLGGKLGDDPETLLTFDVVADAAIALEPGEWSFTIEGYKGGNHILSGSIPTQIISLEGTQTLVFEVEPVDSGTGTVNLTINLPAASGITTVRVFKNGTELETSPIELVGDTIVFTETSDAGEHYFSFKLYNGADLYGVVSEIVWVGAHLESAKTYTLLQKDLNLTYIISYHVPDGTMPDGYYQIAATTKLATPSSSSCPGYYFKGWYEQPDLSGNAVTQIPLGNTGDRDFYSKWIPAIVSGYSLADALALISASPEDGEAYTIILNDNEPIAIAPTTLSYGGKKVDITIEGSGQTVQVSTTGTPLFTLGDGLTLTIQDLTLNGRSGNNVPVVRVEKRGTLKMETDSLITGNTTSRSGGGVYVASGGFFIMSDGAISGNRSTFSDNGGGGVFVENGGTFTMSGGTISNNYGPNGGGVFSSGDFTMTGGVISGNTGNGGGVWSNGTFTMSGSSKISGNSSHQGGGGGGVLNRGTFTMMGGEISGNTAPGGSAAGVLAEGASTFTKSGGVIYGSDAGAGLKNTAGSGNGHAVGGAADKKRDSTVEEDEDLDNKKSGVDGGWVDRWNVTFDADGGAPVTQTARVDSGASLGASMPPDPTRDGYAFGGWYTAQNGGGTQFTAATTVSGAITVYAFWLASASVHIDLRPVPDDPALSATTLLVSEEASFSAGSGYDSYQWYWDGIAISGATSPSYTLAANAELPGVYELSVVVATAASPDEPLSARCQVTITAD